MQRQERGSAMPYELYPYPEGEEHVYLTCIDDVQIRKGMQGGQGQK